MFYSVNCRIEEDAYWETFEENGQADDTGKVISRQQLLLLDNLMVALYSQACRNIVSWRTPALCRSLPHLKQYCLKVIDGADAVHQVRSTLDYGHMPNITSFKLSFRVVNLSKGTFLGVLALLEAHLPYWPSLKAFDLDCHLRPRVGIPETLEMQLDTAIMRLRTSCERFGVVFKHRVSRYVSKRNLHIVWKVVLSPARAI